MAYDIDILEVNGGKDHVKIIGKGALASGQHLKIETIPAGEEFADYIADADSTVFVSVIIVKTPYGG